jgi:hypothetical protein
VWELNALTHFSVIAVTSVLMAGSVLQLVAAKGDSAAGLLERAQELVEHPGHAWEALTLIKKADEMLQSSAPLCAEHARVLDEYAYLLMLQVRERAQHTNPISAASLADWRVQAEPITKQALSIAQKVTDSEQSDIALAVEMEAEALGETTEAKRLWEQSTQVRKRLVDRLMSGQDGGQEHSYCDADGKPIASRPSALSGPEALAAYETVASFAFSVDKDGRPTKIRLLRAVGFGNDEEGAETLSCWHFKPGMRNGKPAPVPASVDMNYRVFWPPVVESKPGDKRQRSETLSPERHK